MSNDEVVKMMGGTIESQNHEFDALDELIAHYKSLQMTPVVDDDYPAQRHRFEGSLRAFFRAARRNRGADYFRLVESEVACTERTR